ncbi:MAG: rhomboid family intramembrane serine protease [Myxococcales bacterium]|nr:rhomboid family intramembrane serine protease [Myxococcales bacterium]
MVEVRIGEGEVETYTFEAFEARVAEGRIPPSARIRFEPVTGDAFLPADELDLYESVRQGAAVAWRARFMNSGPPVLTVLLVGLQIRIWLWAQLAVTHDTLVRGGVNWMSPALENGQPWRLLTYGLLHTDFLHILLNMVWMTYTGWNIERALGRLNLATIFFTSVFVGGLLSMFLTPGVPSLGASGGVYGLVSASVVFGFIRQDLLPEKGRRLFGAALAPYLVLMFLSGLSNAGTDNWAHFGGLVTGGLLAFFLDPPGFERRPRQNLFFQAGGAIAMLVVLVVLGVAGPRVYPLVDREQARLDALPAASRERALQTTGLLLTELTWAVPAGWKPGSNAAGDPGFTSPVRGQDRSVAVVQVEQDEVVDVDAALEAWKAKVERGHPGTVFHAGTPGDWLGRQASGVREVRAELPSGRVLRWKGTSRGMYLLYRVLEVEADREARLDPLFARIDATVDWREPIALQSARRNHLALPKGVKARSELATALAKWGEASEALGMLEALTLEHPEDPTRWVAWLEVAAAYPDASGVDALVDRALREMPEPVVVVECARVLRQGGDPATADGLLQLAWVKTPGDRTLKRALHAAGLRWTLDPTGLPAQLAYLPDGSRRPEDEVQAVLDLPLDLPSARSWGDRVRVERDELAAGMEGALASGTAVDLLLRIRDGGMEPVYDSPRLIRKDLRALRDGRPPAWMSPAVVAALTPERVDALLAQTDPEPEPVTEP